MKKKNFLITGILITLMSLSWIILTPVLFPSVEANSENAAPHRGFLAPGFTLQSPSGEEISLADYEDQPVLVFFWASWCSVCNRTMPGLQAVYEDYGTRGFEILAINTTYQDTLSSAINTFQSQGYTFKMLLDRDGMISKEYRVNALPTSILISPDGKVNEVIIGSGMSEGYLRAYLADILGNLD